MNAPRTQRRGLGRGLGSLIPTSARTGGDPAPRPRRGRRHDGRGRGGPRAVDPAVQLAPVAGA